MQRILHIAIVLFFTWIGFDNILNGVEYIRHPWTLPAVRYYRGEMAVLEGIVFLAVAFGIFRLDSRARTIAIFIAGLFLLVLGADVVFSPRIAPGAWFFAWLLVLGWLLTPKVRAQFLGGRGHEKTV